jgi:hypothetical protein
MKSMKSKLMLTVTLVGLSLATSMTHPAFALVDITSTGVISLGGGASIEVTNWDGAQQCGIYKGDCLCSNPLKGPFSSDGLEDVTEEACMNWASLTGLSCTFHYSCD